MTGEEGDEIGVVVEMTGGQICTFVDLLPSSASFIWQFFEYFNRNCGVWFCSFANILVLISS
jgi:hypothetical protein